MTTTFNKFRGPGTVQPKTLNHKNRDGVHCGGSRLAVHPNTVTYRVPAEA